MVELTGFVAGQYDALMVDERTDRALGPDAGRAAPGASTTCPTCGARAPWRGNSHRPFCSLTCRLVDLGVWLDERYRIEAAPPRDVP